MTPQIMYNEVGMYQCRECDAMGPSLPGIPHAEGCVTGQVYDVRAKLLEQAAVLWEV